MEIIKKAIIKVMGDPNERKIRAYMPIVEKINGLEAELEQLTDGELQGKTLEFRNRLEKGELLESLLAEAFAVVREASKRTLKMRHFDVQLIGGMVLNDGKIAEMKTGEGKTLVATLAAYLNALAGKVYIVTVNDYLARRDHEWMGKIYHYLGLKTGLTIANQSIEEKKEAYEADIIYGTNNEFGFDYLRDNLSRNIEDYSQKDLNFAIVDEVDSILIDEARTPLIISGPIKDSTSKYKKVALQTRKLVKEKHFSLDEKHKNIVLTEEGISELERLLNIKEIYSIKNMDYAHMAVQSLKALYLFKRDVDYVIKDGEVMIVDEFTGRILEGRRYSDGLHQAIEAIENVEIKDESQTLASITFQNYFRMFDKLSGMTGTAITEEAEFGKIYNLEVVQVPTHRVMIRKDNPDVIYKTKMEKYKAIVREIKERYKMGQPVLVGTISIEISELLSTLLTREGIPHSVLNAKYHDKEAEIVSKAGQAKTVTIATNMAGRGTDIVLGEGVTEVGGLHIIGSERHESRRIDNQLRGRSGRQGDPGSSRFYVSLEDDLMRLFGSERIAKVMDTLGIPGDTPIEHGLISKSIERAQKKVEQYHFSVRKQLLEYDDVLNKQRETIYALRKQLLQKLNLEEKIEEFIAESIDEIFRQYYGEKEEIKVNELAEEFLNQIEIIFPFVGVKEIIESGEKQREIKEKLKEYYYEEFLKKKREYPEELYNEVLKEVILVTLDRQWMDHLHNIDILKEGIGLRAWGQRDPLIEYKIEAFEIFKEMLINVGKEVLETIYKMTLVGVDKLELPEEEIDVKQLQYNHANSQESVSSTKVNADKTGRNDLCPCGSGFKYKKCCLK